MYGSVRRPGIVSPRHRPSHYRARVTRLSAGGYLDHIRSESARFRAALAACDPDAPVPSCPEWTAADLLSCFEATNAEFVAALASADPAEAAWSWAAEQTVGFTFRRQAHEAPVHRLDAELAVGALTPLDPALAADGVDEALDAWLWRRGGDEAVTVSGDRSVYDRFRACVNQPIT